MEQYGQNDFEEGNPNDTRMNRVQILMQRTFAGWPLYTMIVSFGQLLSAVSHDIPLEYLDRPGKSIVHMLMDRPPSS